VQTDYEGGFADAILSVIDSVANYATSAGSSTPAYTVNLEGSFNTYWDSRFGILPGSADSQIMRYSSDIYQASLAAIPAGEAISAASDALRAGDAIDAAWAFAKALLSADRGTVPEVTETAPAAESSTLSGTSSAAEDLPDDALVVRGGTYIAARFANASGVTKDDADNVYDVSVNSAPGRSLEELAEGIPNKQIGVTTVGEIRGAGGTIQLDPLEDNAFHCLIGGCTPEQFSELFTPTIKNPWTG
jgi:hypothetical protein